MMQRVGFYPRAAAVLLDILLLAAVSHLAAIFDVFVNENQGFGDFGTITFLAAIAVGLVSGLLEAQLGWSIGKLLMRLAVADESGNRASRGMLWKRTAFKYSPVILVILAGAAFACTQSGPLHLASYVRDRLTIIWMIDAIVALGVTAFVIVGCFAAMSPEHQAYHDRATGTAVFRKQDLYATRGFTPVMTVEDSDPPAADPNQPAQLADRTA